MQWPALPARGRCKPARPLGSLHGTFVDVCITWLDISIPARAVSSPARSAPFYPAPAPWVAWVRAERLN
jgi:hypothetical protein